jgi:hypothetical protein
MLALVIGALLMSGLYVALDMHMTGATAGRIQIDQAQMARFVVKNISDDIHHQLASLDAYPVPASATKNANATTTTVNGATGPYPFNLGVQGEADRLVLYTSRVPKSAGTPTDPNALKGQGGDVQADESDLRRVVYWLVPNSDGNGGLARQVVTTATSDEELGSLPPDVADEQKLIFGKTVVAVSFEYYDGQEWLTEWDGTELLADNLTPKGPPVAIAITISVARPDNIHGAMGPDDPGVKTFRHVIRVPTASFHEAGMNSSTSPR